MKALLMSKNEDFDPKQEIPTNHEDLTRDLELNALFDAMSDSDDFLRDVGRSAILAGLQTPEAIKYRQDALRDCIANPDAVRAIYEIPIESIRAKRDRWLGINSKYPASILSNAVKMIDMFLGLLGRLHEIGENHSSQFESEAFHRFFDMVANELTPEYNAEVAAHLNELGFGDGVLLTVELGKGNEGANYTLSHAKNGKGGWFGKLFSKDEECHTFQISPRDTPGATALAELKDDGLRGVANALAKSAEHIDSFFNMLRLELGFYIGCLNLFDKLKDAGMSTCFSETFDSPAEKFSCVGLYDPCLALALGRDVVSNDLSADGKRLVMITGANQGGKTTLLRSVGVAGMMAFCGMFAPADAMSVGLKIKVFTHFKREEDEGMVSGKLDEELERMSSIVDALTPGSLLLLNESFASTNEREGSEIATGLVDALMEKGVMVFYVTHFFKLANGFYERDLKEALFLRAERVGDGERRFKLAEKGPLRTSYAEDLYNATFADAPPPRVWSGKSK
ncbi:MAG: hypothetical protein KAG97_05530 [Victivallales bacterium]|nr:hypothetical protein [Victivallales bacterium]